MIYALESARSNTYIIHAAIVSTHGRPLGCLGMGQRNDPHVVATALRCCGIRNKNNETERVLVWRRWAASQIKQQMTRVMDHLEPAINNNNQAETGTAAGNKETRTATTTTSVACSSCWEP